MSQFQHTGSKPPSGDSQRQAREGRKQVRHLNQINLADRWNLSERTLERWRWLGEGPVYLKIGGRVLYRLEEVEAYETENLRGNTSAPARSKRDRR